VISISPPPQASPLMASYLMLYRVHCLGVFLNCVAACFPLRRAGFACANGTGVLFADVHGCGAATHYCPAGSAAPTPTPGGFYAMPTPSGMFFNASRCEPGRFCVGGVASECPSGRFGNESGLTSAGCSGNCSAGYFCPASSVSRTQLNCSDGPTYYCAEVCEGRVAGSVPGRQFVISLRIVLSCPHCVVRCAGCGRANAGLPWVLHVARRGRERGKPGGPGPVPAWSVLHQWRGDPVPRWRVRCDL
jgi:hypothetical protein